MEYIKGSLIEEQLRKVKRGVWMGYLYVCEQGASIGIADNRFQVKYSCLLYTSMKQVGNQRSGI